MKKLSNKIKRFFPAALSFVLLICLFVVPVSAANSGWYGGRFSLQDITGGFSSTNPAIYVVNGGTGSLVYPAKYDNNSVTYSVYLNAGNSISLEFYLSSRILNTITPSINDKLFVDGILSVVLPEDTGSVDYMVSLLDADAYPIGDYATGIVYPVDGLVHVPIYYNEYVSRDLVLYELDIALYFDAPVSGAVDITVSMPDGIEIGYGDPYSAEAPSYVSPDGSKFDELEDIEQGLHDDTADGYNSANDAFNDFSGAMMGFVSGLEIVSFIMGNAIIQIPFLNAFVQVSLALGLFAVIVGLSASIIGASNRRGK